METDDNVAVRVVLNVSFFIPKCARRLSESGFAAVKTANTCTSEELDDQTRHNQNKDNGVVKEYSEVIHADLKINLRHEAELWVQMVKVLF